MRRAIVAAVLATGAMLAGCAARPAPRPGAGAVGALPPVARILQSLAERRAALHGVRAFARLSYTAPEESHRGKQLFIVERPDRLRFEVLTPFGAVFVLTAADGALAAYERGEATVYRGAASAANLQRYADVDLPISTAVDLLLGTPPLAAASGVVSEDDGRVKLWQEVGDDAVEVTWFSPLLEPLRYEQRDGDGRVRLRTTFDAYTSVGGVRLPTVLAIDMPAEQRRIEITLTDPEVNPALPGAVFALETPAGSHEIDLDRVAQ